MGEPLAVPGRLVLGLSCGPWHCRKMMSRQGPKPDRYCVEGVIGGGIFAAGPDICPLR